MWTERTIRSGRMRLRASSLSVLGTLALFAVGCVTPAEFRKVAHRVTDLERSRGKVELDDRGRVADLGSQIESLEQSIKALEGRMEVTEHRVQQALEEARLARTDAQAPVQPDVVPGAAVAADGQGAAVSDEIRLYREAYGAWRDNNSEACVEQFTRFIQTYAASEYADDATYWLADCYFKQGNFSAAVLRFDDVARQYPGGNKAPDALYRQGEALLRMGHGKAAGNAFEKVLRDYPQSTRAAEAKKQLDLLGAG